MPQILIRFGAWFARLVAGSSAGTSAAIGLMAGEGATITAQNILSWFGGEFEEEDSQGGVINSAVDFGNKVTDVVRKNFGLIGALLTAILVLAFWKNIKALIK